LDLVRRQPDRLMVSALAAHTNASDLAAQAIEFNCPAVGLVNFEREREFDSILPRKTQRVFGEEALEVLATRDDVDTVVVAVAGAIGIRATVAALCAGKTVLLATKEVLVAAGEVVMSAAKMGRGRLLPIDSEHSAIMQCLAGQDRGSVVKLWLTASGGPFRLLEKQQLAEVTVEQALNHPTWRMGNKISIDSATLMNKGLEMIEARWLFDMEASKIDCVVHPQSVVHSMVELRDGSVIAQLGATDMRLPIEYAMFYPERVDCGLPRLSVAEIGSLTFEPPDYERFECLRLAREAMEMGGTLPAVMNGANEAAVARFLSGSLSFLGIPKAIRSAMIAHASKNKPNLDQILIADRWARRHAATYRE
jgi:1-deoxy-D-xylulose-5-phosphate reductoisomerase